ncbi:MAG: carboxypeptidase-like regulatory domain-containing protein [Ferruginibacter sp.]
MRLFTGLVLSFLFLSGFAQKKAAFVSGRVIDENENFLTNVSVIILGKTTGIVTMDSGHFRIKVPADKSFALTFSYTGYLEIQKIFFLSEGEEEKVTIRLERSGKTLETVVVSDEKERKETGLVKINPKNALVLPATAGGVEGLIKTLVGSNNELTSQYSVRGGNYDENLIYINDFEIFRPYLVRSGQQEGLSFINPEMARNISFYNGGFQARYGDKMSSVLDIQYKRPRSQDSAGRGHPVGGAAYIGLLEQGINLEGASKNDKLTYLAGIRNRSNRNLLSSQETKGAYIPSSTDIQGYFTYRLNNKLQLEVLTNFSTSRFTLLPESAEKTSSVFSPLFTANLGLDIFFEGQERSAYKTGMIGLSAIHQPNKNLRLKWMLSRFQNKMRILILPVPTFLVTGILITAVVHLGRSLTPWGPDTTRIMGATS